MSRLERSVLLMTAALALVACSTTRPWQNQPITADSPSASTPIIVPAVEAAGPSSAPSTPSIIAAVTLSGGGARAAAFGLGVLQELKDTQFTWDGRQTTLLDEVGLVSGVSGKVAKKEYTQIVSVLKSIEALAPGLYGMEITESKDASGKPVYDARFVEHRLEEVVARLNRFKRADERPFEAMKAVAELNQRVYELFGRPVVDSFANEYGAWLGREFHPLRFQRRALPA